MTTLPERAARLAVLTAVHDKIGEAVKEARDDVRDALNTAAAESGLRGASST